MFSFDSNMNNMNSSKRRLLEVNWDCKILHLDVNQDCTESDGSELLPTYANKMVHLRYNFLYQNSICF